MLLYNDLYDPQRVLYDRIEGQWASGQPVVIQAGQRAGKTVIANVLAAKHQRGPIIVVGHTVDMARMAYSQVRPLLYLSPNVLSPDTHPNKICPKDLVKAGSLTENTLVIIDDCFWMQGGERIFDAFSRYTNLVLAIGSKGPSDLRWRKRDRIWRYSSNDLNPLMPEVVAEAFKQDPCRAARDFGNPEP